MTHIAKKSMRYGGKALQPGDSFAPSPRDGRLLVAIGKAELGQLEARVPQTPVKADPLDHDGDGRKGGSVKGNTHKRRDMRAED